MKLIVDMNLSPLWKNFLVRAGIEAEHWSELGSARAHDAEIVEFAGDKGFTILTRDLDFGAFLVSTGRVKPSVIQIRAEDARPDAIGRQVAAALRQFSAELEVGALVTVAQNRTRWRMLPF